MMSDVSIGELYDDRASVHESRINLFDKNLMYSCRFCDAVSSSGHDLESDENAHVHAAAHRISFECLMENNPLLLCPICEVPIVSDEGILTKTHEALFNDRDLVRHLETAHYDSLLDDFVADFGQLSYLLTTFVVKKRENEKTQKELGDIGSLYEFEKFQSTMPVSTIHCERCSWHSLKEGSILASESLVARVTAHLMEHIETGFGVKTDEQVLMWQAEMGALRMHFFSATEKSTDISAFPYAERLVSVYTKQLVQCFGVCYPLVMRILHGLRGNPFKRKRIKNIDFHPLLPLPTKAHKLRHGHNYEARVMRDYRQTMTEEVIENRNKRKSGIGKCGRVECGYTTLDFSDSEKLIYHVFAHIRHDEARLSRALEGVRPIICKCGVQLYSPIGLLYHVCNEHIFDAESFPKDSQQECVVKMATFIISSYSQTIVRGRQRCRDKSVITEWMARMGMQDAVGAEEQWVMVDVAIDSKWMDTWTKFVDGTFNKPIQLETLFTTVAFITAEKQFVDPAKRTYQILSMEDAMNRTRRMFARLVNNVSRDSSKWLIHKRLQRDQFERHRANQRQGQRYHKVQRVVKERGIPHRMEIMIPFNKVTITAPNHSPSRREKIIAIDVPSTSRDDPIQELTLNPHECERDSRESSTVETASDSQDPSSFREEFDEIGSENIQENSSVFMREIPAPNGRDSTDSDGSLLAERMCVDIKGKRNKRGKTVNETNEKSIESTIPVGQETYEDRKFDKSKGKAHVAIEKAMSGPRSSPVKTAEVLSRVHCRTCAHTSFAKDDLYMQKLHAAAHAVLLFRITSPIFVHAPEGISCPGCTANINNFHTPTNFDIANMIRHMMRRHAEVCQKVYSDYLQEKFPVDSFTVCESEFTGKIILKCSRGGCGSNDEVFSNDIFTPMMSHREADVPVLKHLLWHIRNDKGLVEDTCARELLTRVLMSRMVQLEEKNVLVHALKSVSKYSNDKQMELIKYICAQIRRVVCSVFGYEAAWVLQMVLPCYSGRKILSHLFAPCVCLLCKNTERREPKNPTMEFGWDPISAALHSLAHSRVLGMKKPHALSDLTTSHDPVICPICENSFTGKIEAMFHMLTAHTEIATTGLLYPLLVSLNCLDLFTNVLTLSFGSESWQIKHALAFPDQHPRKIPIVTTWSTSRLIPVTSAKKKRTKSHSITEKSPLKRNKVELSMTASSSDLPDMHVHSINKKLLNEMSSKNETLEQASESSLLSNHDEFTFIVDPEDMQVMSEPNFENRCTSVNNLFVKQEPEEWDHFEENSIEKPTLADMLDQLKQT